jgi:polar amino acid transport system permease protein
MFKDAPLGAAIGVSGVLATAQGIGNLTFRYVEPLTTAGFLFLMISIPAAIFVRYIERKVFYES